MSAITRDLDEACMHAVAALLQGLPLQSEESDRGDLMEAKSQLFLKYFTLFMDLLNDCGESGQSVLGSHEVGVSWASTAPATQPATRTVCARRQSRPCPTCSPPSSTLG